MYFQSADRDSHKLRIYESQKWSPINALITTWNKRIYDNRHRNVVNNNRPDWSIHLNVSVHTMKHQVSIEWTRERERKWRKKKVFCKSRTVRVDGIKAPKWLWFTAQISSIRHSNGYILRAKGFFHIVRHQFYYTKYPFERKVIDSLAFAFHFSFRSLRFRTFGFRSFKKKLWFNAEKNVHTHNSKQQWKTNRTNQANLSQMASTNDDVNSVFVFVFDF